MSNYDKIQKEKIANFIKDIQEFINQYKGLRYHKILIGRHNNIKVSMLLEGEVHCSQECIDMDKERCSELFPDMEKS